MTNIHRLQHRLQIPVVQVITDQDYYPLPAELPEPIDCASLKESLAELEAIIQGVAA